MTRLVAQVRPPSRRHVLQAAALALIPAASARADEKPQTRAAYRDYIAALEKRIVSQNASGAGFLWIDQKAERLQKVRSGEIAVERLDAPAIDDGMIQHWIGGALLPNTTLAKVKRVDQDYNNYAKMYAPDIVASKLLSHNGDRFRNYYRLKKQKVFTVVTDIEQQIEFVQLSPTRLYTQSRSTSVREVKNAGGKNERVLPDGKGDGFLWAMNTYWRMEERAGGVYVE